jgi:hypothetical protein
MKRLYPWEYTDREGGNFHPWKAGSVTSQQLRQSIQKINNLVIINGVCVHSLIFESAAAGGNNYARWDCSNGWTTTIAQARKNFPRGYHGEKR